MKFGWLATRLLPLLPLLLADCREIYVRATATATAAEFVVQIVYALLLLFYFFNEFASMQITKRSSDNINVAAFTFWPGFMVALLNTFHGNFYVNLCTFIWLIIYLHLHLIWFIYNCFTCSRTTQRTVATALSVLLIFAIVAWYTATFGVHFRRSFESNWWLDASLHWQPMPQRSFSLADVDFGLGYEGSARVRARLSSSFEFRSSCCCCCAPASRLSNETRAPRNRRRIKKATKTK